MVANNVIQFPKNKKKYNPVVVEELPASINAAKHNHVNEVLSFVIPQLFKNMELSGFDVVPEFEDDIDLNLKDSAFIVEAIRSLLLKCFDIRHPFQDIADNIFTVKDDGTFTIVKHLELDFDPKEFE